MNQEVAAAAAAAFLEHRDAFGVAVTIGGHAVTAVVDENPLGRELAEGGFVDVGELKLNVLAADLPVAPVVGTEVICDGKRHKVARISRHPGWPLIELSLRPANR